MGSFCTHSSVFPVEIHDSIILSITIFHDKITGLLHHETMIQLEETQSCI